MILKSIQDCSSLELDNFSCGNNQLDLFLKCFAQKNDLNGYGKTYVLYDKENLVGFFTLSSAQINWSDFPNPEKNRLPKYPMPCIKIARLAVDEKYRNSGYGKQLLKEAFLKIVAVSSLVGIYLVLVDAKEESISFYEKYGFKRLLYEKPTYYLPIKTIKKAMM